MAKADQAKQEAFVKKHEELSEQGLTIPNIRLVICESEEFDFHKAPDPLHSYRAKLHQFSKKPEFAGRLAPFKLAPNNKKDKVDTEAINVSKGVLVEA